MQNADREAVKPTTASAALNNSHRATASKNASMGLGVSSSGGGGGGDIGSSSESSDPRVGRFQRRNLGDDRSDGEAERNEALWKVDVPPLCCDRLKIFFGSFMVVPDGSSVVHRVCLWLDVEIETRRSAYGRAEWFQYRVHTAFVADHVAH